MNTSKWVRVEGFKPKQKMFEIAFSQNANLKIGVGMCLDGDNDDFMAIFGVQKWHFVHKTRFFGENL